MGEGENMTDNWARESSESPLTLERGGEDQTKQAFLPWWTGASRPALPFSGGQLASKKSLSLSSAQACISSMLDCASMFGYKNSLECVQDKPSKTENQEN